jgi:copper chaperone
MSTTTTIAVDGMTCGHCVAAVKTEVGKLEGVSDVSVDLATGLVTVVGAGAPTAEDLRAAVEEAGYEVRP